MAPVASLGAHSGAGFIGGEFDGNSVALFQKLVDVESLQLKSMIMVERRDDQGAEDVAYQPDEIGSGKWWAT